MNDNESGAETTNEKKTAKVSYIRYLYDDLEKIPEDIRSLQKRVATEDDFNFEDFQKEKELLEKKEDYLNEAIRFSMQRLQVLKQIKKNPDMSNEIKGNIDDNENWLPFKDNIPADKWVPAPEDFCDRCGRTQTSTTVIAAAITPLSNQLEIICSRCLSEELTQMNKTTETQGEEN